VIDLAKDDAAKLAVGPWWRFRIMKRQSTPTSAWRACCPKPKTSKWPFLS